MSHWKFLPLEMSKKDLSGMIESTLLSNVLAVFLRGMN